MKKIKKVAVSNIPAINGAVVDSFNAGVDKTTNAPSIRAVEEILENYSPESSGSAIDTLPIGSIMSYTSDTAPNGWLNCDGSAVSRTEYSKLFSIIGVTYGAGNGTTTFNLPNIKGKVLVGKDGSDSDFDTLGKTGGEKTHTLTVAEMPSHRHSLNTNINATGFGTNNSLTRGYGGAMEWKGNDSYIETAGSDQPHNNLQPYIVMNYIIKAKQTEGGSSTKLDSEIAISETEPIGNEKLWINPEEENFDLEDSDINQIIEEQTTINIITGEECATNEYIDGKRVYRKRINCGVLPSSAGIKRFSHGIRFNEVVRIDAFANGGGYFHPIPYVSVSGMGEISEYSICICVDHSTIYLAVGRDRSDSNAIVTLYYTKNDDWSYGEN